MTQTCPSASTPRDITSRSKILIINTRTYSYDGESDATTKYDSAKDKDIFREYLEDNHDFRHPSLPAFDLLQLKELRQSADIGPSDWVAMAQLITDNYNTYDGFVVQHGTDTMVYSAAALSFMLQNLGKPVIFTGALVPINHVHSDMKQNIILALFFAKSTKISEVCILFAERLFRANRVIKVSRRRLQPFETPHFMPLATMRGNTVTLEEQLLRAAPTGRLICHTNMTAKVMTIRWTPGSLETLVQGLLDVEAKKRQKRIRGDGGQEDEEAVRAVVLCAFGTGNLLLTPMLLQWLDGLLAQRIVVVVCSQNRRGTVELEAYAPGKQLATKGVVSAGDMTLETTIVKLKYLFGRGCTYEEVIDGMKKNLRGEKRDDLKATNMQSKL